VLAATNRHLEAAVSAGTFREDLFYRLNVFPIRVPSLRERKDDIPLLVEYLVERYAKRAGKRISHIKKKTLDLLQAYDWPGNIRELQNVVERAVILCDEETFSVDETWLPRKSNQLSGPRFLAPVPSLRTKESLWTGKEKQSRLHWQNARVGFQGAVARPQCSEFRTKPWSRRSPASA
jgi:transcriptional regulator with PAS, ATPase and Fis domain